MDLREKKFLDLLAKSYPNMQAVATEIINLQAILNLPKGTEHFLSDIHGEYEAFLHIRNNASGVIREKVELLYANKISAEERGTLSTLIYYPKEKLEEIKNQVQDLDEWYKITLNRLLEICRLVASKYTRSKIRKLLPGEFEYIIEELLNNTYEAINKQQYYANIIATIVEIGRAEHFIIAVCDTIKNLVVDHLHIVGDIFDRGPRADIIMDSLMTESSVDFQWGNHDILWMGAASGSRTCIATVLNNSITYNNLDVIELGYGISLRPLAIFANETYQNVDVSCFMPKLLNTDHYTKKDILGIARMHKAIAIIQFKLEGNTIRRNPQFGMEHRLLLDKIDYEKGTVLVEGTEYRLKDYDFPTIDRKNPYKLSPEELEIMEYLKNAFLKSEKLQRHIEFLYDNGDIYKCYNSNLLFHGCMPLNPDGSFMEFDVGEKTPLSGKNFIEYCDSMARQGYYAKDKSKKRQKGLDFLWFLWCGKDAPTCGRKKIATFERLLIEDKTAWKEDKNAYYSFVDDEAILNRILEEFGLGGPYSHIINGHVPVITKDGETPIKGNGKLIVIDGGFCKAYQSTTGIAGYTLIYSANGIRLSAHEPFDGTKDAIQNNRDILSTTVVFERAASPIKVAETDVGKQIKNNIQDLKALLTAYETGDIKENVHLKKYKKK